MQNFNLSVEVVDKAKKTFCLKKATDSCLTFFKGSFLLSPCVKSDNQVFQLMDSKIAVNEKKLVKIDSKEDQLPSLEEKVPISLPSRKPESSKIKKRHQRAKRAVFSSSRADFGRSSFSSELNLPIIEEYSDFKPYRRQKRNNHKKRRHFLKQQSSDKSDFLKFLQADRKKPDFPLGIKKEKTQKIPTNLDFLDKLINKQPSVKKTEPENITKVSEHTEEVKKDKNNKVTFNKKTSVTEKTAHSPTAHSPTTHSPTTHSPTTHSPAEYSPATHSPTEYSPTIHSKNPPLINPPETTFPSSKKPPHKLHRPVKKPLKESYDFSTVNKTNGDVNHLIDKIEGMISEGDF
ncbi:hypothetical protein NUSPORA_00839 [Nucleospora cyclopteri]